MRYQIREKAWTLGDQYSIHDAAGSMVYEVHGKPFSWGDDLSLVNAEGEQLARITQTRFTVMPVFGIERGGQAFAELRKEFSWFNKTFTLDVPGPNDYTVRGSFWAYEYRFERFGKTVAQVSREFFTMADTYGVDIVDGEDDVSILATVIVIDLLSERS